MTPEEQEALIRDIRLASNGDFKLWWRYLDESKYRFSELIVNRAGLVSRAK